MKPMRKLNSRNQCDIEGCTSTITHFVTRSSENFYSIHLCDNCLRDAFACVFPDDAEIIRSVKAGESAVISADDKKLLSDIKCGYIQLCYPGDAGFVDNNIVNPYDNYKNIAAKLAEAAEEDKDDAPEVLTTTAASGSEAAKRPAKTNRKRG